MKKSILFFLVAVLATSCNGQDSKHLKSGSAKSDTTKDSIAEPNERWQVNKEIDENGNIIRYDSIYSWSSNGLLRSIDADSLIDQMQQRMKKQFSTFQGPRHLQSTEQDSIIKQFFSDDIFNSPLRSNFPDINVIIRQMEAMRQHFFNQRQRYIIPPETSLSKPKDLKSKQI
jgi:hypothetical protein